MGAVLYKIKCLTNLHVGSSEAGFGVIDKSVARDPTTNRPIIHASGVKGALRQYFEAFMESGEKPEIGIDLSVIRKLFGKESENGSETEPGELTFLSADMLAITVRGTKGSYPYYLVTTHDILSLYNQRAEAIGFASESLEGVEPNQRYRFSQEVVAVEGIELDVELDPSRYPFAPRINEQPKRVVVLPNDDYKRLRLPIVARNNLTEKRNLWYEEFVPHQSVFVFAVLGKREPLDVFNRVVSGGTVQFGGNASVGYGLTKVTPIEEGLNV